MTTPADAVADPLRAGRLRRVWGALGPGLVTGASDDDPSGIATYAQAGARFGFGLLWTALITLPLMMAIQEICDRTALATGKIPGASASASATGGGSERLLLLVARRRRHGCLHGSIVGAGR